jgi:integrase
MSPPGWGHRPIASISRAEINELLDEFVMNDRVGTSREVRKSLTRLFGWAAERGMIASDPTAGMRRRDPAPKEDGRALSLPEVRELWRQATTAEYPYGSILKLLLLTGIRLEELRTAKWSMIDEKRRTLTLSATQHKTGHKTGQGIVVPFCTPAWQLVKTCSVQGRLHLQQRRRRDCDQPLNEGPPRQVQEAGLDVEGHAQDGRDEHGSHQHSRRDH